MSIAQADGYCDFCVDVQHVFPFAFIRLFKGRRVNPKKHFFFEFAGWYAPQSSHSSATSQSKAEPVRGRAANSHQQTQQKVVGDVSFVHVPDSRIAAKRR